MLPISILLAACLISSSDQDHHDPENITRQIRSNGAAATNTKIDPPKNDDTTFVVDTGPGLDTACTYRNGSPLRITLKIPRYVGEVNADGTLRNQAALIANGVLSSKARLRLPVYDVDVKGAPGYQPEVDHVSINGHKLEPPLTGDNEIWKANEYDIPIEDLRFPSRNGPPADNVIEISIDEASKEQSWCTAADWVAVSFDAVAPIFLVHGVTGGPTDWNTSFTNVLDVMGIPWSRDVLLPPNGTIRSNGEELSRQLEALAESFGAKKCHIVAHSKGGLDTRAYLALYYHPDTLKVVSVHTLSTPFLGSVLADIRAASDTPALPQSSDPDLQHVIEGRFLPGLPTSPALEELTVASMKNFDFPVPTGVAFYSYVATADADGSHDVNFKEADGLGPSSIPPVLYAFLANTMYQVVGSVASVHIEDPAPNTTPIDGTTNVYPRVDLTRHIEPNGTVAFLENDCVVTEASATFGVLGGTFKANHKTIKSKDAAMAIANTILEIQE